MALRTTIENLARLTQRPPGAGMALSVRGARWTGRGRGSCAGAPPPPACPCTPHARPPCRALPQQRVQALKVTCCPPLRGKRPPCAPCPPEPPLTCTKKHYSSQSSKRNSKSCIPKEPMTKCGEGCGNENERVERRLAAEERVRREHYERETSARAAAAPPPAPAPAGYCLGSERECARATDGRQYTVLCKKDAPGAKCGPGREPPPPECVELIPDGPCQIRDKQHMDPCAHRRRTLLVIDRSQTPDKPVGAKPVSNTISKTVPIPQPCPKKSCEIKPSKLPAAAQPCQLPTVTEALLERGPGPCDGHQPQTRAFHTIPKINRNQFSTNKFISRSTPDVKIKTMNRATSPFVKHMSANSCAGNNNKKSSSWASFEKLKKACFGLGTGNNQKNSEIPPKSKLPPPCGSHNANTEMMNNSCLPPNPCAPKRAENKESKQKTDSLSKEPCFSKQSKTNPCTPKQPLTNPINPKQPCPCPCTQKQPMTKAKPCSGNEATPQKTPSSQGCKVHPAKPQM